MRLLWMLAARPFGSGGGVCGTPAASVPSWRRPSLRVRSVVAVIGALSTMPMRSVAQPGGILRSIAEVDRPSLLDDGDADSLRTAIARSLGWLDRQPPGRPM